MSRTPKPWYWKQRRVWCAYINGKKVVLGHDRTEAHRKFHELMAAEPAHVASDSVAAIIDTFLDHIKDGGEASAETARWYERHLQSFWEYLKANGHRSLTVGQFKPHHVQSWLDSHRDWSGATKNGGARAVKRAFRWAETQEYIARSPLARWRAPKASIRDTYVSEADHLAILALVTDEPFRDLLTVAWETGARPQELVRIEARHVDVAYQRVVFTLSEGKKERRRVIYLPDKSFAIVKRQMEAYPEGPILRNTRGQPWTPYSINCRFIRIEKKLGRKFCLTEYRHGFGTRSWEKIGEATTAELMGHADLSMLKRVYGKVAQNPAFMLAKAKQANEGASTSAQ